MPINQRVIAREWLLFFLCLVVGFFGTLVVFFRSYEYQGYTTELTSEQIVEVERLKREFQAHLDSVRAAPFGEEDFLDIMENPFRVYLAQRGVHWRVSAWRQFTNHLVSPLYFLETWASVLFLYFSVQLARSLLWSVRVVFRPGQTM